MKTSALHSRVRRSLLFVPGDDRRRIDKAAGLPADTLILDLEDGVAPDQKETARLVTAEALRAAGGDGRERLVRLNGPDSEPFPADLAAVLPAGPAGLVLPKIDAPARLAAVEQALDAAGAPADLPLFALIESPLAVLNLPALAAAGGRLAGLLLGAEDLAAGMGAERTPAGWEVFYARSALVTAAAAYGLAAYDMVFTRLDDPAGLAEEAAFARRLGFAGKMAIHPRQLGIINDAFTPTPAEVDHAERLLAAYAAHQAAGKGAFAFEGRLVDAPVLKMARAVIDRTRAAGGPAVRTS